jgi:predicted Zn-dependent protease
MPPVRAALPKLSKDPKVILIGFTSDDMYPLSMNWNFAFGWRVETSRTAVVSTARMDLHYPGEPSAIPLPETRLRKMVTKDIGILYYGLPESNNPRSVLYGRILGIEELDTMSEEF